MGLQIGGQLRAIIEAVDFRKNQTRNFEKANVVALFHKAHPLRISGKNGNISANIGQNKGVKRCKDTHILCSP